MLMVLNNLWSCCLLSLQDQHCLCCMLATAVHSLKLCPNYCKAAVPSASKTLPVTLGRLRCFFALNNFRLRLWRHLWGCLWYGMKHSDSFSAVTPHCSCSKMTSKDNARAEKYAELLIDHPNSYPESVLQSLAQAILLHLVAAARIPGNGLQDTTSHSPTL